RTAAADRARSEAAPPAFGSWGQSCEHRSRRRGMEGYAGSACQMNMRYFPSLLFLAAFALPAQQPERIFRITPVRPVAELRTEALSARPPLEHGDFRPAELVDLAKLDPAIRLDIRYATRDNFLSTPVYSSARAFLQRPAAEALLRA